jgi:hypothetical protein
VSFNAILLLHHCITSYGRNLLLATRSFVESKYTIENGYKYNAEVLNPLICINTY